LYGNGVRRGKRTLVLASEAKQSIFAMIERWIAAELTLLAETKPECLVMTGKQAWRD
jgi:hypothetical protein